MNHFFPARTVAAIALVFLAVHNGSQAAQITSSHATISIVGAISEGDVDKFKSSLSPESSTVVLNSPGGLVDAAFGIIDIIRQHDMRTLVPEAGMCFSACAYIFMNGKDPRLHYTAQLGFHATWINLSDNEPVTGRDIRMAFRAGQQDIKRLLATQKIPLDLILEFIDKGPDEFYLIDTVHKARALGISVYGFYDAQVYPWKERAEEFAGVAPFPSAAYWVLLGRDDNKLAPADVGLTEITSFRELAESVAREFPEEPKDDFGRSLIRGFQILDSIENSLSDHKVIVKANGWGDDRRLTYELDDVFGSDNSHTFVQFREKGDLLVYKLDKNGVPLPTFLNPLYALPPGLKLTKIPEYQLRLYKAGVR